MKIDLMQVFKDENDDVIKTQKGEDFTLQNVCCQSLLATGPQEQLSGEEKEKRYDKYLELKSSKEIDLKSEDIAELKKLIGANFPIIIVGQAYKMLEGN